MLTWKELGIEQNAGKTTIANGRRNSINGGSGSKSAALRTDNPDATRFLRTDVLRVLGRETRKLDAFLQEHIEKFR